MRDQIPVILQDSLTKHQATHNLTGITLLTNGRSELDLQECSFKIQPRTSGLIKNK